MVAKGCEDSSARKDVYALFWAAEPFFKPDRLAVQTSPLRPGVKLHHRVRLCQNSSSRDSKSEHAFEDEAERQDRYRNAAAFLFPGAPCKPSLWELGADCGPAIALTLSLLLGGAAGGLRATRLASLTSVVPASALFSAGLAMGGSASCMIALSRPSTDDAAEMSRRTLLALACACGMLTPLPLVLSPGTAWAASIAGPISLMLPGACGAVVIFEFAHRSWLRVQPAQLASLAEAEEKDAPCFDGGTAQRVLQHWQRHFTPFKQQGRGSGLFFLLAQLALTSFGVSIDLAMTDWRKTFFNALQSRDVVLFHYQLKHFVPVAAASLLVSLYDGYLATMWDLKWREELTQDFMNMWLSTKSYYCSRFANQADDRAIDNFDQRIVEDTALFASNSRALICGALSALMRLAVFGPALIHMAPAPYVWQLCLALSAMASVVTHLVGNPLSARSAALQRAEADFRTSVMRLRIFAEEIALQQGEAAEQANSLAAFENIKAATWLAARGSFYLTLFTASYGLAGNVLPCLVLGPAYFRGDIALGTLFQLEGIIAGVRQSLDYFVGTYAEVAEWRAATDRLLALEAAASASNMLEPSQEPQELDAEQRDGSDSLGTTSLALCSSSTEPFLGSVSFEWCLGDRVILPAGARTRTLLRSLALAGLPPRSGTAAAAASTTPRSRVLLVGTGGFAFPPTATLRKCLAYPEAIGAFDEDICDALAVCGLENLAAQLDRRADWSVALSVGDRQRLIFARLLARWPGGVQWLVLEEADSALDVEVAQALYERLANSAPRGAGIIAASCHQVVPDGWRRCDRTPGLASDGRQVPSD